jgi:hypothetical protein
MDVKIEFRCCGGSSEPRFAVIRPHVTATL